MTENQKIGPCRIGKNARRSLFPKSLACLLNREPILADEFTDLHREDHGGRAVL